MKKSIIILIFVFLANFNPSQLSLTNSARALPAAGCLSASACGDQDEMTIMNDQLYNDYFQQEVEFHWSGFNNYCADFQTCPGPDLQKCIDACNRYENTLEMLCRFMIDPIGKAECWGNAALQGAMCRSACKG